MKMRFSLHGKNRDGAKEQRRGGGLRSARDWSRAGQGGGVGPGLLTTTTPTHLPPPHPRSRPEPPDHGSGSVRAVPAPSPLRRWELHDFPSFQVGFGVFFLFLVVSWGFFPC